MATTGLASGDFRLGTSGLRILYHVFKDTICSLAADGFTQTNPSVVGAGNARSSTLPLSVKKGVLGGSVAFTRPDVGGLTVGGAAQVASAYVAKTRPLGLFLNDAVGNANESISAVGSGKCPHVRGGTHAVKIYETQIQTTTGGATVGTALTYAPGDRLYASVNGLLTNRWQDSYETQWITTANLGGATSSGTAAEYDSTLVGVLLGAPDSNSSEMIVALHLVLSSQGKRYRQWLMAFKWWTTPSKSSTSTSTSATSAVASTSRPR